jgi:hypothetical protein
MTDSLAFLVARDDLQRCRLETAPIAPLEDGELLLRVDRYSFTANNVTYAETGKVLRYWQFYPAPEGWGIIPVWGFADVVESRHPAIAPGERVFGYLPMSTHVRLRPDRVDAQAFVDATPHRRELAAAYNSYQRCAGDPSYDAAREDLQSLFRGLFSTGFLIDDFLADREFFSAGAVVLSSASSKTALSLAHQLCRRDGDVAAIGLTSPANRDFVTGLGIYDRVVTYDRLGELPSEPSVFVDFAGSGKVRTAIHEHFADNLRYSMAVGMSHRDLHPPGKGLPGPKPSFFFAPERRAQRLVDWGRDGFAQRFGDDWRIFLTSVERWLTVTRGTGPAAVEAVYRATLDGKVSPADGHILSM